jgi:secreted trypsin-like serine protease
MPRLALVVSLIATASTAYAESDFSPDAPDSDEDSARAIVGGSEVQPGQWPDAVAVLGRNGACTGTLIAPDVVLTAGHCAGIDPVQVIANTTDYAQSAGVRSHVAKTEVYPSWQTSYDVAVLVLVSPIEGVAPRKVGTSCTFEKFARDTSVRLVGFGATDMAGAAPNTQLKQAMTSVTDPECVGGNGCKKAIAPGGEFVAGGTGNADSCFGDSGGPVYLDTPAGTIVIGAVSRGVDNAATPCGGGGIYVRTDKLVEWLEQTTGREIAKDACDVTYATDDFADDGTEAVGCSATRGGAGLGGVVIALLALARRRRRPTGSRCAGSSIRGCALQ